MPSLYFPRCSSRTFFFTYNLVLIKLWKSYSLMLSLNILLCLIICILSVVLCLPLLSWQLDMKPYKILIWAWRKSVSTEAIDWYSMRTMHFHWLISLRWGRLLRRKQDMVSQNEGSFLQWLNQKRGGEGHAGRSLPLQRGGI